MMKRLINYFIGFNQSCFVFVKCNETNQTQRDSTSRSDSSSILFYCSLDKIVTKYLECGSHIIIALKLYVGDWDDPYFIGVV